MGEGQLLKDRVREDLVLFDVEGDSCAELLLNISKVLMEKGIVKDSFYDALMERENSFPTGLPIGEINVAIPHTYPEHINEVAITVAIPKKPVLFRNMGNPNEEVLVSIVVCITMRKMDDNVKLLPELMDFFSNEQNLKDLLECNTPAEVIALISA